MGRDAMGLLNWFRKGPEIVNRDDLLEFIDTRAAFLIQKNIYDYTRARSGPYFKVIIKEAEFAQSVERSRWTSYPLALAAIAEMIYGIFYHDAPSRSALVEGISKAALEVFDRYPVPAPIGETEWAKAREDLKLRMTQVGLHPPKAVKDIFMPTARQIYDALPIHEELRKSDFEMIQNQLRINLVTMYDEFEQRADKPAVLAAIGFHMS